MALDKQVFATRTKTALVYAVVMLTGLLWNEWSFFLLFSVVHFGCWYEYQKLSAQIDTSFNSKTLIDQLHFPMMGWGWMLMAASDQLVLGTFKINEAGEWLVQIGTYLLPARLLFDKQYKWKHMARSFGGIVYLSISLALFVNLRSGWIWSHDNAASIFSITISQFSGKLLCLLLVFGIWINDTMAYVVGSFIGKTPLSSWSPKKTWEGFVGALISSLL